MEGCWTIGVVYWKFGCYLVIDCVAVEDWYWIAVVTAEVVVIVVGFVDVGVGHGNVAGDSDRKDWQN